MLKRRSLLSKMIISIDKNLEPMGFFSVKHCVGGKKNKDMMQISFTS